MFDFSGKLHGGGKHRSDNPLEIYETLDRASDKGPLRVSQSEILNDWYKDHKSDKDLIIKLHTGSGKTLIGLLILQSNLNSSGEPVMYLCPNKFLVDQTCEQAKQFGVKVCQVDANNQLPQDFLDAKSILVATTQLLFNGLTKFGLKQNSLLVNTIVLDDSHACIDTINDALTVRIDREDKLYSEIFKLFEDDLEEQGEAALEEIRQGEFDSFLNVPYWAWNDKISDVVRILVNYREEKNLLFVWNLIKDNIKNCQCIISGTTIEISPYNNPIKVFGTFSKASHRIFMSATTSNDAFFIKGLGVDFNVVQNPLRYSQEKWSGEKMILTPYFIHHDLTKPTLVSLLAKPNKNRKHGIVVLVPSRQKAKYWQQGGAEFPFTENIQGVIREFKAGNYTNTLVLANRYDGIDLPDDNCRVLVLDSKPITIGLADRLQEHLRETSQIVDLKTAQKIEQGMGRAVRGEKDYCVVLITGISLMAVLSTNKLRRFFSPQTRKQIEIGRAMVDLVVEQAKTDDSSELLSQVLAVSLKREESWKKFYAQEMNSLPEESSNESIFHQLDFERQAEELFESSQFDKAVDKIQELIDKCLKPDNRIERAYYLQEMARYAYGGKKSKSNDLQIQAYKLNRLLLKPRSGVVFQKLEIDKRRTENIFNWINQFESYYDMELKVQELINNMSFGKKHDIFEKALNEFGLALGFACERPDKELKKGPDNLWNIKEGQYILFECKNEISEDRAEILKDETGQMNNSCAWFSSNYHMEATLNVMIIPTKMIASSTGFNSSVHVLRKGGLTKLKGNFRKFFMEFSTYDLKTITEQQIDKYLRIHELTVEDILRKYAELSVQKRS